MKSKSGIMKPSKQDFFNQYRENTIIDETMLVGNFGGRTNFFSTLIDLIQKADSKKILRDTGKLLSVDQRNWIKTSFLGDFQRLVSRNLEDPF